MRIPESYIASRSHVLKLELVCSLIENGLNLSAIEMHVIPNNSFTYCLQIILQTGISVGALIVCNISVISIAEECG